MTGIAIAGAGGAIGSKIAAEAAARGCSPLWLIDCDPTTLNATAAAVPASSDPRPILLDITSRPGIADLEADWLAGPSPETVVNAVGTRIVAALDTTTDEQWDNMLNVNLTGAFLVMRAAARAMKRHGTEGAIVNVVSVASEIAFPLRAAYCATKAGVVGLTRAAAIDLAPHGIRVIAVSPGVYAAGISAEIDRDQIRAQVPLGRAGDPAELAVLILDLARNRFLTGGNIVVDGGAIVGKH